MTAAGEAYFNATGNAGLAKGGSGDILTGMVLALLAQGYSIPDAAMIAVHVHGEAADKVRERLSMQGMLPSDVVEQLPASFRTFEQG
jgi:NAD(P)H-hydrate epimerase